jgi:hypothetical protein
MICYNQRITLFTKKSIRSSNDVGRSNPSEITMRVENITFVKNRGKLIHNIAQDKK